MSIASMRTYKLLLINCIPLQICKLAMELSLINSPDNLKNFYSLDAPYFVSFGKGFLTFKAKESHAATTEEELSFHEGEMIEVTGTRGDGFSVGRKKGTKEKCLIPSDKIKMQVDVQNFPTYPTF